MKKKTINPPSPANDRNAKHDMSLDEIQELIKMLGKSNVSELSIERKNFKITLRTHQPGGALPAAKQTSSTIPQAAPAVNHSSAPVATEDELTVKQDSSKSSDDSKYITIKSPMIGTFYRSSSPDKPPFINVGDEIQQGSVLCVIEAMKLFNEIESEHSGKIVKILVENAKPVEYDQPLFLLEPM